MHAWAVPLEETTDWEKLRKMRKAVRGKFSPTVIIRDGMDVWREFYLLTVSCFWTKLLPIFDSLARLLSLLKHIITSWMQKLLKKWSDFHLIWLFPMLFYWFLTEAFDLVLRHGRNSTLAMLKSEFPGLGGGAQSSVGQLFLDMSLYILGSDSTVDHMVAVLYGRLFSLTYRRLLGGSMSSVSEECVRGAWKDSGAFGPYPKRMMTRLSRSLLATRVFLQALNLGIEVVNTTDHLRPSRDCSRALLRLWFCPHCQGMLGPPACRGFCQAVMHGCLGGAAEVQPHWRSYVDGLGKLAGAMTGEQDMEDVVLTLPSMIKQSLKHAVNARTRLNALVSLLHKHTYTLNGWVSDCENDWIIKYMRLCLRGCVPIKLSPAGSPIWACLNAHHTPKHGTVCSL